MLRATLVSFVLIGFACAATAAPSRIVILVGGETAAPWKLCESGKQRAQALRYNYLGEEAAKSLFEEDEPPAFCFSMTLPGLALATPASLNWRKPVISYTNGMIF